MSDPLRIDSLHAPSIDGDAERDAKIEALLLSGLDHYFASDYAQAIDIWTRALFLDRQHARARAYIDRARSALAEQQRESEELVHNGVAAFERGEIEPARQLLTAAVQHGGAHEVALAFLTRIDRIDAAARAGPAPAVSPPRLPFRPSADPADRRGSRRVTGVFLAAVLAVGLLAFASWNEVRTALSLPAAETGLVPLRPLPDAVIIPTSSERALERGRALFASGRLYDALRAVDLVRPTDPLRSDADRLKAAIQRELLAHQPSLVAAEPTGP